MTSKETPPAATDAPLTPEQITELQSVNERLAAENAILVGNVATLESNKAKHLKANKELHEHNVRLVEANKKLSGKADLSNLESLIAAELQRNPNDSIAERAARITALVKEQIFPTE